MQVEYLAVRLSKTCRTELCNTIEKTTELIKNTCEGENNSIGSKKLIYSRSILNPESTNRVSECYHCDDEKFCSLEDSGTVEKCEAYSIGCRVK